MFFVYLRYFYSVPVPVPVLVVKSKAPYSLVGYWAHCSLIDTINAHATLSLLSLILIALGGG